MKKELKENKHNKYKWYYFIFPIVFLALSVIILIEGASNGNSSSTKSSFFASIFDFGKKEATIIKPTALKANTNTTSYYIGKTYPISISFQPIDTSDQRVTYEIKGDTSSISIINNNIQVLKEGNAIVKIISLYDNSIYDEIQISTSIEPITELSISLGSNKNDLICHMTDQIILSSNRKNIIYSDVTFYSSNSDVIEVNEEGILRCKKIGSSKIYCKANDITSNEIEINVIEGNYIPITEMYVNDMNIYVNEEKELNVSFNDNCSDTNYLISNNVNGIIQNNKIKYKEAGTYSLTITSRADNSFTKTINIKVNEVKAKSITASFENIQYGKPTKLIYSLESEVNGLEVTNKDMIFASSDPTIATIDNNGYILGLKKGMIEITISWKEDTSISLKQRINIISLDSNTFSNINHIVRKLIGHFLSFFVTGLAGLFTYIFFLRKNKYKIWFLVSIFVYGLLLAIFSEIEQMFTSNRTPAITDVLIDYSGYVSGAIIVLLIFLLIIHHEKKNKPQLNN